MINGLSHARVLVVDNEPLVAEAMLRSLQAFGYAVKVASSGHQALGILSQQPVDLCISDFHMPGMDGASFIREVHTRYPLIPIVVLTGDGSIDLVRKVLDSGASDFIIKPWRVQELPLVIERNLLRHQLWVTEQKRHLHQLNQAYSDLLEALLCALETREKEIEGHSERVTAYTMILAEAMELPTHTHPDLERGALLHDVGKIGIPDHILFKEGPLNESEWEIMRQHPLIGYRMCTKVQSLQIAAKEIVLCHHERWDGSGYPQGLRGEEIPLSARIFAVADAFDALTSDRPYRKALSIEQALEEIERCAGTYFDPQITKVLLGIPSAKWELMVQNLQRVPLEPISRPSLCDMWDVEQEAA